MSKKYLSLNENGDLEELTKQDYKSIKIKSYVICDIGHKPLMYLPIYRFTKILDTSTIDIKVEVLEDIFGNLKILVNDFYFAKIYNRFTSFFAIQNCYNKNLRLVECSRALKPIFEQIDKEYSSLSADILKVEK